MNLIFRTVWNRTLGRLVVASEAARSQGKAGVSKKLIGAVVGGAIALPLSTVAIGALTSSATLENDALLGNTDGNLVVSEEPASGTDPQEVSVDLADDITLDSVTTGDTKVDTTGVTVATDVTLGTTGLVINGGPTITKTSIDAASNVISNVGAGVIGAGSKDAVIGDQLNDTNVIVAQNGNSTAAVLGGNASYDDATGKLTTSNVGGTGESTVDAAISSVNSTINNSGLTFNGDSGSSSARKLGDTVDITGDSNITTTGAGTGVGIALKKNLDLGTSGSIKTGNSTLNTSGLTINGGPNVTTSGIDADGKKITKVGSGNIGSGSTDAVNGGDIYSQLFETSDGIKYFHANSPTNAADSVASGAESLAIGPLTKAEGDSSFAAGDGALTTEEGEGAIALGQKATAGGAGQGDGGAGAIAVGRNSSASGTLATALGDGAQASAGNATALGAGATASGDNSIALGRSTANGGNAIAAGTGAVASSPDGISLGTGAGVFTSGTVGGDQRSNIAIGKEAGRDVTAKESIGIGFGAGSNVTGDNNTAIGTNAGTNIDGEYNIAMGFKANENAGVVNHSTVVGGKAMAGSNSVALGFGAGATGTDATAVGNGAQATSNGLALGSNSNAGSDSVALGNNSSSLGYLGGTSSSYLTGETPTQAVVSVGNSNSTRRIVNVADGALGTDAINVNQLKGAQQTVADLVGGGVLLNADGSYGQITVKDTSGADQTFATVVEAIGAVTSGAVEILPPDAVKYNADGGISNVEAGVNAKDVVNVEQLNQEIAAKGLKYFSANSSSEANEDNTGATGTNALAIGARASAQSDNSLALGFEARVADEANNAVAIGTDVRAAGVGSTVLGNQSRVYGEKGVAIGHDAVSDGENSLVMGTGARANDKETGASIDNAIVIGTQAKSTASEDGIAIGRTALAKEDRAVAEGFNAESTADDAMAFGSWSRASGVSSQASGTRANASGENAQASGTDSSASGFNAIAQGTRAKGYATDGIAMGSGAIAGFSDPNNQDSGRNTAGVAIGQNSLADEEHALALGVEAKALAKRAAAVGDGARATGTDSLAMGTGAAASAQDATAFGREAAASAQDATAFGRESIANKQDAIAFGRGAESSAQGAMALGQGARAATNANDVALGAGSVTGTVVNTPNATVDKKTYTYAGANATSTVSVGTKGSERTVTHVAAGRVEDDSTDAINGSQLFGTNQAVDALGNDLDTAGQSIADSLGGNSSYDPDDHIVTASLDVNGDTYTDVESAIQYAAGGWDVSAEGGATENVAPGGSVDFSSDNNIDIARVGTNLEFGLADEIKVGTSITVGDTVIKGDSIETTNLTVEGETKLGDSFVVNNDNTVTYDGQEIANQGDGLSFAGNTGGDIEKTLGDTTPLTISGQLAASEATTGANLRVDSDGNKLNLVMAKNLTDLDSVTINDGGPTINRSGIDMGAPEEDSQPTNKIINLAPGEVGTDAVNVNQLTDVEAIANAGWNVSGSGEDEVNIGPNGKVDFQGDSNISVAQSGVEDDGQIDITLNETIDLGDAGSVTTGDTVMNGDGVTVGSSSTNDPNTTVGAGVIEVAGSGATPNTITVDGEAGTIEGLTNKTIDGTDFAQAGRAATEEQLDLVNTTANAGWNVSGDGANEVNIGPNGKVDFTGDDNLTVTQTGEEDAGKIEIALGNDINIGKAGDDGVDGKIGVNGKDGSSVVINGEDGSIGLTGPAGENGEPGVNGTITVVDGKPGLDGTDGTRLKVDGKEVATTDDGLKFAGNTGDTIAKQLNETLTVKGELDSSEDASGANLRVDSDEGQLNLVMAKNLTDLDSATFGNGDDLFTINKGGVQFVNAAGDQRDNTPSIAADGIDGGDKQITGVGSGLGGAELGDVSGDDLNNAVNVGDLQNTSSAEQGGGFGLADADGNEVKKDLGEAIKVVDPDNNIITTADNANGELQLSLSNALSVGGDGKDGYIGVDGADGTTGVGIDGKDGKITITSNDGIPGEDGIDGMAGSSADIFVKKGAPGVNGVDGETTTRIVYTDPEGNPQEVATLEDGLNFAGNTGDTIAKQLNETLNIEGELDELDAASGANLRVDSADGKLNLVMAKNLTDLDSATFGNGDDLFTINKGGVQFVNSAGDQRENTPSITETGIDGGDNQITGVGSGLGGQDLGDVSGDDLNNAANIGDLQSTSGELTKKGLDFAGNRGDVHKDLGDTLTIRGGMTDMSGKAASGKNIRTVISKDGEMVIQMSRNLIDLDSITINNDGPAINKDGIDMRGGLDADGNPTNKITNLAKGDVSKTSTDGINGSQLWEVESIAKAGWNLTTDGDTNTKSNVAPEDTVDFSGDGNVLVSNEGNNVSVALADKITLGENENAITVDGTDGSITTGDTIMDGDGVRVGDKVSLDDTGLVIIDEDGEAGPSVTINGIYAGNQQITGVASGLGGQQLDQISGDDLMNAVNVGDLQTVAGDIGKDVAAAKTVVTPGKNIEVTESTGENGESVYEVATSDEVEFDKMEVGTVTIDKDNVDDEGNTIIAGVGKGDVSADSTDAVNGSQLHQVKNDIGDINTSLDGGLDFAADEGDAVNRKLGDTVGITGDDNITTRTSDDGVQVTLNRDLAVDSVTTGRTTINDNGVSIEGGPSMTVNGIDGGGKRITNVAPGVDATDAANVGQLQELNQNFYNEMGNVHNRIDDLEDNAYAGVASAIAAASVPQTVHSGESMFAVGAGTYKGESAVSVGVSRLSDNGRMAIKLNVTGDSQGNFGAGVGAGWHW